MTGLDEAAVDGDEDSDPGRTPVPTPPGSPVGGGAADPGPAGAGEDVWEHMMNPECAEEHGISSSMNDEQACEEEEDPFDFQRMGLDDDEATEERPSDLRPCDQVAVARQVAGRHSATGEVPRPATQDRVGPFPFPFPFPLDARGPDGTPPRSG